MTGSNSYFFCGIGGSGMLPLASILRAQGAEVAGSDRALDQGRLAAKFDSLRSLGIRLFPQDGSGLVSSDQVLVASAAVEESVPDVQAALRLGCERIARAELLARLFNAAETGIAVGGTSGKSTVTGMIGWILAQAGLDPTVMNGAVMKNFATRDAPFASARVGGGGLFVSEVDESDGSIALYEPEIAVLTNISLDHKTMEELRSLFSGFLGRASSAILNIDDEETRSLAAPGAVTFSLREASADYFAAALREEPFAASFTLLERSTGGRAEVRLNVPGRHNVANALAAIAAARAAGVGLAEAAVAMAGFQGLRRRFERVGEKGGVTVIDDFAHNPDKIAATLATCRAAPGRLLLFFQPHGYGPLRAMREQLVAAFAGGMGEEDVLLLSDPVYYGGTVEKSVGSGAIVEGVRARGRQAEHVAGRSDCGRRLVELTRPGDRILIMGARDDSLSQFAEELLASL